MIGQVRIQDGGGAEFESNLVVLANEVSVNSYFVYNGLVCKSKYAYMCTGPSDIVHIKLRTTCPSNRTESNNIPTHFTTVSHYAFLIDGQVMTCTLLIESVI